MRRWAGNPIEAEWRRRRAAAGRPVRASEYWTDETSSGHGEDGKTEESMHEAEESGGEKKRGRTWFRVSVKATFLRCLGGRRSED